MEKGIHQSGHNPDTREPDEQKGDTYLQNVFLQLITSSLTLSDQGHLQMLGKKKKKKWCSFLSSTHLYPRI